MSGVVDSLVCHTLTVLSLQSPVRTLPVLSRSEDSSSTSYSVSHPVSVTVYV